MKAREILRSETYHDTGQNSLQGHLVVKKPVQYYLLWKITNKSGLNQKKK